MCLVAALLESTEACWTNAAMLRTQQLQGMLPFFHGKYGTDKQPTRNCALLRAQR